MIKIINNSHHLKWLVRTTISSLCQPLTKNLRNWPGRRTLEASCTMTLAGDKTSRSQCRSRKSGRRLQRWQGPGSSRSHIKWWWTGSSRSLTRHAISSDMRRPLRDCHFYRLSNLCKLLAIWVIQGGQILRVRRYLWLRSSAVQRCGRYLQWTVTLRSLMTLKVGNWPQMHPYKTLKCSCLL
jgi:hypothetical protein